MREAWVESIVPRDIRRNSDSLSPTHNKTKSQADYSGITECHTFQIQKDAELWTEMSPKQNVIKILISGVIIQVIIPAHKNVYWFNWFCNTFLSDEKYLNSFPRIYIVTLSLNI